MLSEIISDLGAFGGLPAFITAIIITYGLEQALALKLIVALAIAYIVTFTIRIAYFKQRPKQQKYNTILQKIDASSFPSLHSMRATILAILLSQYLGNILISITLAILAIGTGFSRVYSKRHYTSDVIAGIFAGILITVLIT